MPLYEYVCATCGKFESYVRSWGEEVACPTCRGRDVEKQLSTFAFTGTDGGGGARGGGCGCSIGDARGGLETTVLFVLLLLGRRAPTARPQRTRRASRGTGR